MKIIAKYVFYNVITIAKVSFQSDTYYNKKKEKCDSRVQSKFSSVTKFHINAIQPENNVSKMSLLVRRNVSINIRHVVLGNNSNFVK